MDRTLHLLHDAPLHEKPFKQSPFAQGSPYITASPPLFLSSDQKRAEQTTTPCDFGTTMKKQATAIRVETRDNTGPAWKVPQQAFDYYIKLRVKKRIPAL